MPLSLGCEITAGHVIRFNGVPLRRAPAPRDGDVAARLVPHGGARIGRPGLAGDRLARLLGDPLALAAARARARVDLAPLGSLCETLFGWGNNVKLLQFFTRLLFSPPTSSYLSDYEKIWNKQMGKVMRNSKRSFKIGSILFRLPDTLLNILFNPLTRGIIWRAVTCRRMFWIV